MTIVGVDISTFAVHTAWLENGQPRRWHCELGTKKDHVIDRVRAVHIQWPLGVTEVVIEYPYSVNRETNAHLMAVVGAVAKSTPSYCRVTWESSQRLRAAIGAPNTKVEAHDVIRIWTAVHTPCSVGDWDEHELDALIAAVGWQRILEQQDAA